MGVNQLKSGALLSYVSLGLYNVVGLLYTPLLLKELGQSEYGLYSLVASIVGYLVILDLGFYNAIIRYTAQYRAMGKIKEQYSMFGMFIILYSFIGLIAFLFGLILYFNVDLIFDRTMTIEELSTAKTMMFLLIANIAITFPLSIFGSIIHAYEKFIFKKVLYIIRIALQPCIMIPLLLMGYKSVALVVVISLLNIFCLLANCWYCFAKLKIKVHFDKFDISLLKEIGGYSFFIFVGVIVEKIYWGSGQFILGAIIGTIPVAIFSVSIFFQQIYTIFSTAISDVLYPKINAMISKNATDKDISDLFIRTGRLQYIVISFILTAFCLFGKEFIMFWAGEDYEDSFYIALIFFIPLTVTLIQNIGVLILQARNQLKYRTMIMVSTSVLCIALSIPLAKVMSGIGIAISIAVTLTVSNIFMNFYYNKNVGLNIIAFWREIIQMSYPILMLFFMSFALQYFVNVPSSIFYFCVKAAGYSILFGIVLWCFSLNSYERQLGMSLIKPMIKKLKIFKQ